MAKKLIILGLGTNMGDRLNHLQNAVDELSKFIEIEKISSVYETPPFDMEAETNFYNICLYGFTEFSAQDILLLSQKLERESGRIVKSTNGTFESRPLDIDILYFGDQIIHTSDLIVPHPEIHKRRFVLEPLNEILSEHFDPLRKLQISQLLTKLEDNSAIHKIVQQIRRNK